MCWPEISARLNRAILKAFRVPITYQCGGGDPISIDAYRHRRPAEEFGVANMEQISVDPADLPNFPARGDTVQAWGMTYSVVTPRQPDPYGLVEISLVAQAAAMPDGGEDLE